MKVFINIVIYAWYFSDNQREKRLEYQIYACTAFAKKGIIIEQ